MGRRHETPPHSFWQEAGDTAKNPYLGYHDGGEDDLHVSQVVSLVTSAWLPYKRNILL